MVPVAHPAVLPGRTLRSRQASSGFRPAIPASSRGSWAPAAALVSRIYVGAGRLRRAGETPGMSSWTKPRSPAVASWLDRRAVWRVLARRPHPLADTEGTRRSWATAPMGCRTSRTISAAAGFSAGLSANSVGGELSPTLRSYVADYARGFRGVQLLHRHSLATRWHTSGICWISPAGFGVALLLLGHDWARRRGRPTTRTNWFAREVSAALRKGQLVARPARHTGWAKDMRDQLLGRRR